MDTIYGMIVTPNAEVVVETTQQVTVRLRVPEGITLAALANEVKRTPYWEAGLEGVTFDGFNNMFTFTFKQTIEGE